jgi:uncharacterized membrane protein YfcA
VAFRDVSLLALECSFAMTPVEFMLVTFVASVAAGLVGSILGLGGGIIVVPTLTLLLGVNIRFAIGASIVSVIATSTGAAAAYVREHLTNLRLGMLLEVATTAGALGGAYVAGAIPGHWLQRIFGILLAYVAVMMFLQPAKRSHSTARPDAIADGLRLHSSYFDVQQQAQVTYRVGRTWLGLLVSWLAGAISGMLGVGGGILKVPVMALGMNVPMKAATATSNFMIGVTAAASAGIYFLRGEVDPFIAAPVVLGITVGATTGSRLLGRLRTASVRRAFVVVLIIVSFQMLTKKG